MIPISTIDSLPFSIPTDFILGAAGLGSVIGFGVGMTRVVRSADRLADPLRDAGYGAGIAGLLATALWLGSLFVEVTS